MKMRLPSGRSAARNGAFLATACALALIALAARLYNGERLFSTTASAANPSGPASVALATPPVQTSGPVSGQFTAAARHDFGPTAHHSRKEAARLAQPENQAGEHEAARDTAATLDQDSAPQQNIANAIDPDGRPRFFSTDWKAESSR